MSPPPDDEFELGPEHEDPDKPGDFFPLGPEHETPAADIQGQDHPVLGEPPREAGGIDYREGLPKPFGQKDQWEAEITVIKPNGETGKQYVRIDRDENDTEQDIHEKLTLAMIEIQLIIAERGGEYDAKMDISSITPV